MNCGNCGAAVPARAKFCGQCGRVRQPSPPAPVPTPYPIDPYAPTEALTPAGPGGVSLQVLSAPPAQPYVAAPATSSAAGAPLSELRVALLECFLPGAGLIYGRRRLLGVGVLLATLAAVAIAVGIYDSVVQNAVTHLTAACSSSVTRCGIPNYTPANGLLALLWLLFSGWTALRVRLALKAVRRRNTALAATIRAAASP